ncbi:hypothetical protein DERF_014784 [Dermatophagoides farinae]|uniref:Uncharacterized protein n=1 Tax=Dermatophagoides farinae TaxID=6954 RepID=A0A922L1L9_DERFA|nr:hypothetical protein DERF_014784 [Dermatophagoides farinae]
MVLIPLDRLLPPSRIRIEDPPVDCETDTAPDDGPDELPDNLLDEDEARVIELVGWFEAAAAYWPLKPPPPLIPLPKPEENPEPLLPPKPAPKSAACKFPRGSPLAIIVWISSWTECKTRAKLEKIEIVNKFFKIIFTCITGFVTSCTNL